MLRLARELPFTSSGNKGGGPHCPKTASSECPRAGHEQEGEAFSLSKRLGSRKAFR